MLSIFVLPDFFTGQILISPQKVDVFAQGLVPLQFNFGNVTQLLYLSINVVFAITVAIFTTRGSVPYQSIIRAYLAAGYVVTGLVFWQLGSSISGIPFTKGAAAVQS